ncbi:hypothetical protein ACFU8W_03900 [Streptomyces sp. NPDC057565]|uniref:hypothetical protein n=1 Tax=Streptomyces sp. NPDC057565 TaxID=3346169 RepID=UPI003680CA4D
MRAWPPPASSIIYGAPVPWRLALRATDSITAIITQNGNAYREGFVAAFWDGLFAYAANPDADTEKGVRAALTLESTRWQYLNGVSDPSPISPDTWTTATRNRACRGKAEAACFEWPCRFTSRSP